MKLKTDFVLIRTEKAGVHFGTLVERKGQEVHLSNARRLWSWTGALSLSELSVTGPSIPNSKISVLVDEIILPQMIEMLPIQKSSTLNKL